MKAKDIFNDQEIIDIKKILCLFNGKITKIISDDKKVIFVNSSSYDIYRNKNYTWHYNIYLIYLSKY